MQLTYFWLKCLKFFIDDKPTSPTQHIHGAVMLPIGILQLGSFIQDHFQGKVETHYLDLHLNCRKAYLSTHSTVFDWTITENFRNSEEHISLLTVLRSELKNKLETIRPQIVGVSCTLNAFDDNFHMTTALIKEFYPDAVVVGGGHYPSSLPEPCVQDENLDYVVIAEGELPFKKFVEDFLDDQLPNEKIVNDKKIYLKDFNAFPKLEYEKLEMEEYLELEHSNSLGGDQGRTATLVTSRGCPLKCTYCATHNVWDYGFRYQSAQNVFEQVVELKEKYNVETVMFLDDIFVLHKKRTKEFCRLLIEHEVEINWYPTSVLINALDEEMITLMAKSGCASLGLAVESGVRRVQKMIKKGVRLDHCKKIVEYMRREGMRVYALFVLGFPNETMEEIKETLRFARDLKCDWAMMNIATPLYGTEMYETCQEENFLPDNLTQLCGEGNITTSEFTAEKMEEIITDANFRMNFLENYNYVNENYEIVLPIFKSIARSYPKHFICRYMIWKISKKLNLREEADVLYKNLESLYWENFEFNEGLIETFNLDISFPSPAIEKMNSPQLEVRC